MVLRWSPGKNPTNTVHVNDVAGAAWAAAKWMAPLGREAANGQAGVELACHIPQSEPPKTDEAIPKSQKVVAPVFNVVSTHAPTCKRKQLLIFCRLMIQIAPYSVLVKQLPLFLKQLSSSSILW